MAEEEEDNIPYEWAASDYDNPKALCDMYRDFFKPENTEFPRLLGGKITITRTSVSGQVTKLFGKDGLEHSRVCIFEGCRTNVISSRRCVFSVLFNFKLSFDFSGHRTYHAPVMANTLGQGSYLRVCEKGIESFNDDSDLIYVHQTIYSIDHNVEFTAQKIIPFYSMLESPSIYLALDDFYVVDVNFTGPGEDVFGSDLIIHACNGFDYRMTNIYMEIWHLHVVLHGQH